MRCIVLRTASFAWLSASLLSCSSDATWTPPGGETGAGVGAGQGGSGASGPGSTVTGSGTGGGTGGATGGGGMPPCGSVPTADGDADGYTPGAGDCDDCDPNVNPGALEFIADPPRVPADEDCSGAIDDVPVCDGGLLLDDADPQSAAAAIELCALPAGATWVLADGGALPGNPTQAAAFHLGHGILPDLGPVQPPRRGQRMLMLSSGTARRPTDPGFVHRSFDKQYTCNSPDAFLNGNGACPNGASTGPCADSTALELQLETPLNAGGFSFDFAFFSYEWPEYVCTVYSDFFVANVVLAGGAFPAMLTNGNVAFDGASNPITTASPFLRACGCPVGPPCGAPPGMPVLSFGCALGTMPLSGTDFEVSDLRIGWSHASTGWLRTTVPVDPGTSFTLRLVTYDSGDHNVDSAALVDNFAWKPTAVLGTLPVE